MAEERSLAENVKEGLEEARDQVSEAIHRVWPFRTEVQEEPDERDTAAFPVDICETEEAFVVVGEMPGVSRKGVNIQVSENELIITGRFQIDLDNEEHVTFREIPGADYRRTFTLSDAVDRDKIAAELKDGLLTVCLAKSESVKPREIEITG
jgi:HSP20 family molecular chaperone IbpA